MASFKQYIPNLLTVGRLLPGLGICLLILSAEQQGRADLLKYIAAFLLLLLGGVTDILDGRLARRWGATSSLGRRLDPLVDKLFVGAIWAALAWRGYELTGLAWWMVVLVMLREAAVSLLRNFTEACGWVFSATWAGKTKMFLQNFTIGTIIIYLAYYRDQRWAVIFRDIIIWTTLIFTLVSSLIYLPRLRWLISSRKKRMQE